MPIPKHLHFEEVCECILLWMFMFFEFLSEHLVTTNVQACYEFFCL